MAPNPFEPQELLHFFRHGIRGRLEARAACGFSLSHALRQRRDGLPLLAETVAAARRQRGPVPQAEGLSLLRAGSAGGQHQAVRRAQPLAAVDDPRPSPFRRRSSALPLAAVCFLPTGAPDPTPHLPFPRGGAEEHREQLLPIAPSRLGPPVTAIYCNAGRVHHAVLPPWGAHQRGRQQPSRPAS